MAGHNERGQRLFAIPWLSVFVEGVVLVGPELVPDSIAALETETRHD